MFRRNQSPRICAVEGDPRSISFPPTTDDDKQDMSESMGIPKNKDGRAHSGASLDRL